MFGRDYTMLLMLSWWQCVLTVIEWDVDYFQCTVDTQPCPKEHEGTVQYAPDGDGFTISKGARIGSKTSYNLLNGSISFDMNLTNVPEFVNSNVYLVTNPVWKRDGYCDGHTPLKSGNCMELDLVENNGDVMGQGNWQVFKSVCDPATCDKSLNSACSVPSTQAGSCVGQTAHYKSKTVTVKAEFDSEGGSTLTINGQRVDLVEAPSLGSEWGHFDKSTKDWIPADGRQVPVQDPKTKWELKEQMRSHGVYIYSSLWEGWVPTVCDFHEEWTYPYECPGDNSHDGKKELLPTASLTVSNIKIVGTPVEPTLV